MGVKIDDARGHSQAIGVEHPSGRLVNSSDGGNTPIANRQIRNERRHTGAIINPSIL
jgi:hypothetical protein